MKNYIIFFAPKFKQFGIDVVEGLIDIDSSIKIIAICTGGEVVKSYVEKNINPKNLEIAIDLEYEEKVWLSSELDKEDVENLDDEYGSGVVGEVVTADRRVGAGYLFGGDSRPDDLVTLVGHEKVALYVQELFRFINVLIDRYQPDLVFSYAVAGAPAVAFAKVATKRNIKFKRLTHTRIGNRYVVDDDYKGLLSCVETEFREGGDDTFSDEARRYLDTIRTKPEKPEYTQANHSEVKAITLVKVFVKLLVYSIFLLFKFFLPRKFKLRVSLIGLKRKLFEFKQELSRQFYRFYVFDKVEVTDYIYFPLHVDPEASTMVLSPFYTNQLAIIEAISKSLPSSSHLIVKEHIPMLGKRPRGFYNKIRSMPRVFLVDPYSQNSFSLILNSRAVAVITGTVALEAAMLGKKAVVVGDSPFLCLSSIRKESDFSRLAVTFKELEKYRLSSDSELECYLSSVFSHSFTMKASLLWGNYKEHAENERAEAVINIVKRLLVG